MWRIANIKATAHPCGGLQGAPGIPASPWLSAGQHFHILDTQRYTKDCKEIFEFVLNHNPIQFKQETNDFDLTKELYSSSFSEVSFLWDQILHDKADSCCGSHPPKQCCD